MKTHDVWHIKEDGKTYYFIRRRDDGSICFYPTKYLKHKTISNRSPNTVRRIAFSLSYYLGFLEEKNSKLDDIYDLSYTSQMEFFQDFLYWIKGGRHTDKSKPKLPENKTCNAYLHAVFNFYEFLEMEYAQFGHLKIFSEKTVTYTNAVGIRRSKVCQSFDGYLKEVTVKGKSIEREKIITLLDACSNCRDQLLLLMLSETGFRIGELLGVRYTEDIDFQGLKIRVKPREDNENEARAKYEEYRWARVSKETFDVLLFYCAKYRDILKGTEYLFVTLTGKHAGMALTDDAVHALFRRLEKKTKIKVTPHMLRHYFANERRINGWALELISQSLGHRQLQTTLSYLNISNEELIEATERLYEKNKSLYMVDQLL